MLSGLLLYSQHKERAEADQLPRGTNGVDMKMGSYMSAPNTVALCVDTYTEQGIQGELYHCYKDQGIPFSSLEQAFLAMDRFYDQIRYPFQGNEDRSFVKKTRHTRQERMTEAMSNEELLRKHGEIGTFIIQVQYRQHSSWQGMVTWVDRQKTVPFRSALELMKLIDGVVIMEDGDTEPKTFLDGKE